MSDALVEKKDLAVFPANKNKEVIQYWLHLNCLENTARVRIINPDETFAEYVLTDILPNGVLVICPSNTVR